MILWLKRKCNNLYANEEVRESFAGRISMLSLFAAVFFVCYLDGGWLPLGLAGMVVPIFAYKAILSAFSNEPMRFDDILDDGK